jgi:hypothetical protein
MATALTNGSFRVPNSIIQGLTTSTTSDLNQLGTFEMLTLLGLLTKVSPKSPQQEVRTRPSEILEIIEVSREVAHAVDRQWENEEGEVRQRRYLCQRYSPKHVQQINAALLVLFDKSVVIRRWDTKGKRPQEHRVVHILDSFGYCYERDGKTLDLDYLPPDREKVDVSVGKRPVWRVRRKTTEGERFDRPSGITFRINTELANELIGKRGSLCFTLLAHKVFGLFRRYMRSPAAIRLVILILRQTKVDFSRGLRAVVGDLGFDTTHPLRAVEQLGETLGDLQTLGLVQNYSTDTTGDKLSVAVNRGWYRQETDALNP